MFKDQIEQVQWWTACSLKDGLVPAVRVLLHGRFSEVGDFSSFVDSVEGLKSRSLTLARAQEASSIALTTDMSIASRNYSLFAKMGMALVQAHVGI